MSMYSSYRQLTQACVSITKTISTDDRLTIPHKASYSAEAKTIKKRTVTCVPYLENIEIVMVEPLGSRAVSIEIVNILCSGALS